MELTRAVEFIHQARLSDFPESVVRQARRCFLDLLAASFAGIPSRTAQIAREFAYSFDGKPECSLFGDSRRVPLPLAVLANTTICEALDCDDGFNAVKGHPGAFLFPTVLAFAERSGLSEERALEALIVGYEIGMRAGLMVHSLYPSYHGSGSWGGVGTAAIASRLLGLGAEQTAHALATAEYHGTMAPIMRCCGYPGMVKDGVAWSAFSAVSGALMACRGFTSTTSLFALTEAAPHVENLGAEFLIERLYFKPYCCCRWAHAPVRAALQVMAERSILPADIARIEVATFAEACALSRKYPDTSEEAQYNVAYPIAAALVHGDVGPEQVLEGHLADHRVRELSGRVEFRHREDFQKEFPARRLAEVKITAGGRTYSSGVVAAHGDPSDPMSDAELHAKFIRYSKPYTGLKDAERILKSPLDLASIRELLSRSSSPPETPG